MYIHNSDALHPQEADHHIRIDPKKQSRRLSINLYLRSEYRSTTNNVIDVSSEIQPFSTHESGYQYFAVRNSKQKDYSIANAAEEIDAILYIS